MPLFEQTVIDNVLMAEILPHLPEELRKRVEEDAENVYHCGTTSDVREMIAHELASRQDLPAYAELPAETLDRIVAEVMNEQELNPACCRQINLAILEAVKRAPTFQSIGR